MRHSSFEQRDLDISHKLRVAALWTSVENLVIPAEAQNIGQSHRGHSTFIET